MIEITTSLSNKIIRRGDTFSVYVDISNGTEKPISLTRIKLVTSLGFIDVTDHTSESAVTRFTKGITSFKVQGGIIPTLEFEWKPRHISNVQSTNVQGVNSPPPPTIVQPNDKFRADFNLQVGNTVGFKPRPDNYTISGEVTYLINDVEFHKQINFDVNVFPSLAGMLCGTLLGSFLGTMTKNADNLTIKLIPVIMVNLVLSFIVGIVLMRKKDVQPFLTVEDFWGGILLGFLVGFSGLQMFQQLTGLKLSQ